MKWAVAAGAPLLGLLGFCGCSLLAGYQDLQLARSTMPRLDSSKATIYSVFPTIFSQQGDLRSVTRKLSAIHDLGFNVISVMPITPIGKSTPDHKSVYSPYCVQDYYGINPSYGAAEDVNALVREAHRLGMYVVLDQEINHTSWDNSLIASHPEWYAHSDGDPHNVHSIKIAFTFNDVAQLDYQAPGLAEYMIAMLQSWLSKYEIDGFRFITVDLPRESPTIPKSFWQALRPALETVNPNVILWADEEDPAFAGAPFEVDDGWILRGGTPGQVGGAGLEQVANGGSATMLQSAWQSQSSGYAGVKHATFLQTWDFDLDSKVYGSVANAMAAATFDFTIDGIPMVWNGEEVGNDQGGPQTGTPIDWNSPNAGKLTAFYSALLALRNGHSALQSGNVTWLSNSSPDKVVSFTRSDANETMLILISFGSSPANGTVTAPSVAGWIDVTPAGSPGGTVHPAPPVMALAPSDFAVFVARGSVNPP